MIADRLREMTYDISRLNGSLSDPSEDHHQQQHNGHQQRMAVHPEDKHHFAAYDERRHSIADSEYLRLRRSISRTSSCDSLDQVR